MHRRRLNLCALWLLPLVIARLCVPDGFMVSMTGAGIEANPTWTSPAARIDRICGPPLVQLTP